MGFARMGGCAQTATVLVSTQAWPCCTPSIMASVTVSSVRHLQSADTGKSITIFSINLCGSSTDIQVERVRSPKRHSTTDRLHSHGKNSGHLTKSGQLCIQVHTSPYGNRLLMSLSGVHNRHKLPGLFSDALTVFKSQTSVDQERQTGVIPFR